MQSYPLTLPFLRVLVDGTDRTDEILAKTLRVHKVLGAQVDTCSFEVKAKETYRGTAGSKPVQGQSITVELRTGTTGAWIKHFGGTVQRVREVRMGYKTVAWNVECVDYTGRLQKVLVNETYVGTTVSDIVQDVVSRFAPFVSTSGIQATPYQVGSITFARQYPADVIQRLAEIVGYEWWVSPDSVLYFVDPNATTQVSPNTVTDTSQNYYELTIEPQLDQVRNRIFAYSDQILSDEVVDEYQADGVKTIIQLGHNNVVADLSRFMTINGVPQFVILAGVQDEGFFPNVAGFSLDAVKGEVRNFRVTAAIPDTDRITFRYKYKLPGAVMREDVGSQNTVAVLEDADYASVVLADSPLYYYRLNETAGTAVANAGTAGVAASGFVTGNPLRVSGPLPGNQGVARFLSTGQFITTSRGTVLPSGSLTMEAWVQNALAEGSSDVIGRYDPGRLRGSALSIVEPFLGGALAYTVYQANLDNGAFQVPAINSRSNFDHVVVRYEGQARNLQLYVNAQLLGAATIDPPGNLGVSGILIGSSTWRGAIAEPAIYNTALSTDHILTHYSAGRYGGVREKILVDNEVQTLEHLRNAADKELERYGTVLTDVSFRSMVPDWEPGQLVTVNVTQSGTGRTFSGTPLIQDMDMVWIGNQRPEYRVHAIGTRYNVMDYYRTINRLRQLSTSTPVSVVREQSTTVIFVGAAPRVTVA